MIKIFGFLLSLLLLSTIFANSTSAHTVTIGSNDPCPAGHHKEVPFSNVCIDDFTTNSSGFKFTLTNHGFTNLGPLIQVLITLAFTLAGLLFLAYFLIGGLQWITSGGDPKNVAAARSRITNAFVGFILVVASYAIILIVEKVFGINIVSGITFK